MAYFHIHYTSNWQLKFFNPTWTLTQAWFIVIHSFPFFFLIMSVSCPGWWALSLVMLPLQAASNLPVEADYSEWNLSTKISVGDENKNVSFPLLISEGNACFVAFGSSWPWSLITRIIKGKKRQGKQLESRVVYKSCVLSSIELLKIETCLVQWRSVFFLGLINLASLPCRTQTRPLGFLI